MMGLIPSICLLPVYLSMFAVGIAYNDEESCKLEAASFLAIGGGIASATIILNLIAICTPCENDDKIMMCITPISTLAQFGIIIWGSVVVFGQYSTWNSDDIFSDDYCAQTPFMFAFVTLILDWILVSINFCCACCAFFGILAVGAASS